MEIIHLNTSEDVELNEMSWTKVLLDNLQNVAYDNDSESDLHQSNHNIDKNQVQGNKLFNCTVCKSSFSQEYS